MSKNVGDTRHFFDTSRWPEANFRNMLYGPRYILEAQTFINKSLLCVAQNHILLLLWGHWKSKLHAIKVSTILIFSKVRQSST
jgi:hypothetical protein